MEEKKITITKAELIDAVAEAVANIVDKEHDAKMSLVYVIVGGLINAKLCEILFNKH